MIINSGVLQNSAVYLNWCFLEKTLEALVYHFRNKMSPIIIITVEPVFCDDSSGQKVVGNVRVATQDRLFYYV